MELLFTLTSAECSQETKCIGVVWSHSHCLLWCSHLENVKTVVGGHRLIAVYLLYL